MPVHYGRRLQRLTNRFHLRFAQPGRIATGRRLESVGAHLVTLRINCNRRSNAQFGSIRVLCDRLLLPASNPS